MEKIIIITIIVVSIGIFVRQMLKIIRSSDCSGCGHCREDKNCACGENNNFTKGNQQK